MCIKSRKWRLADTVASDQVGTIILNTQMSFWNNNNYFIFDHIATDRHTHIGTRTFPINHSMILRDDSLLFSSFVILLLGLSQTEIFSIFVSSRSTIRMMYTYHIVHTMNGKFEIYDGFF